MRRLSLILVSLTLFLISASAWARDLSGSGGTNAPQHLDAPYVILVSIDGYRWDYVDWRESRSLKRIAEKGARAERLVPVFPTLTFPNHYSIVTGLYPSNHGIVANSFPLEDGSWYRIRSREKVQDGRNYDGTPIWVAAESQGMVTASFFWVGSEADIQGVEPTHFRLFDKQIKPSARVKQVLKWLREPPERRPHFITLYFELLDDYSHWYGAGEPDARKALRSVDRELGRLFRAIARLPHADQVNIIIVSDHGQANYLEPYEPFSLEGLVDLQGIQAVNGGSYLFLHFNQPDPKRAGEIRDKVNDTWQHGKAWLPSEAPPDWRVAEGPRTPDVILIADVGFGVISSEADAGDYHPGDHGWRPEAEAMHGVFVAHGPAFKQGVTTGPVRNIDIYPMLLDILGLENPGPIDGNPQALKHIRR